MLWHSAAWSRASGTIIWCCQAAFCSKFIICEQAWSWLEGSGLEANSTCMNAVVGALARGSAWRGPRGLAGGQLENPLAACDVAQQIIRAQPVNPHKTVCTCKAGLSGAELHEARSVILTIPCKLLLYMSQAASWLAAGPLPAVASWRRPAAAAGAAALRRGSTPRWWRPPA